MLLVANPNTPGKNKCQSSNFCWLRSVNHVKFTEECVMHVDKYILVKMFTNGLNMSFPLRACVKMTVHGMETH